MKSTRFGILLISSVAFLLTRSALCLQAAQPVEASAPAEGLTRADDRTLSIEIPGYQPGRNRDAKGVLHLRDFSFDGREEAVSRFHLARLAEGTYELTADESAVGEWKFAVDDGADGYYGTGERFDVLNHTHQIIKNSSQDNAVAKGTGTYKPIPFFMSTTGYGLWLDTTAEATFDFNVTSRDTLLISVPAQKLRVVLFTGPKFPTILDRFTAQAGRSILPPYWSMGPWIGRDYHRNDEDVYTDMEKTRSLGLPGDVILIDSPWATGYNSYVFNPRQFKDAPAMIRKLHQEAFKLVLWHTSWINSATKTPGEKGFAGKIDVESSNYKEAAEHGYFIKDASGKPFVGQWWKGTGSLIDFTNPAAKSWWQGQVAKAVAAGADGFKDDDAEGNFLPDVRFADGTDPRLMRNRYAVLYNRAVEEVLQDRLKGNGVLFTRSATVGNHNLAFLWGGDNEASFSPENGLRTVVTAGLNAGMSGMPLWTADLGGYLATPSTPDPLLFMRWTEFSAFSPVMETITTANLNAWDYGEHALSTYRKYAVLHMSLFPYRYAAVQQASQTGMPLLRALVLQYQDDATARETRDELMFGPDFLVAPVIDRNTSRAVYLPQGGWIDYWTGEAHAGGSYLIAQAPEDVLPLYVRAGAIIPKIPEDVMTLVPPAESGNTTVRSMDDRRVYELYAGAPSSGRVVVKDFESRTLTREAGVLRIEGKAAEVTLRWPFGSTKSVTVNGRHVPVISGERGPSVTFSHRNQTIVEWK